MARNSLLVTNPSLSWRRPHVITARVSKKLTLSINSKVFLAFEATWSSPGSFHSSRRSYEALRSVEDWLACFWLAIIMIKYWWWLTLIGIDNFPPKTASMSVCKWQITKSITYQIHFEILGKIRWDKPCPPESWDFSALADTPRHSADRHRCRQLAGEPS